MNNPNNKSAKSFSFTINNYKEETWEGLKAMDTSSLYMCKEIGESGTPHIQGSITFKKSKRLDAVRAIIPGHVDPTLEREASNNYCIKTYVLGLASSNDVYVQKDARGSRTDLQEVADAIKKGSSARQVMMEFPTAFIKYHGGIERSIALSRNTQPRDVNVPTEVYWLYGGTGSGKTRSVFQNCDPDELWVACDMGGYHRGYQNQNDVLLDDFRGHGIRFSEFLTYIDRYPKLVKILNSYTQWNPKRIFITSSMSPEECYPGVTEDKLQLTRRLTGVIEMKKGLVGITSYVIRAGKQPENWKWPGEPDSKILKGIIDLTDEPVDSDAELEEAIELLSDEEEEVDDVDLELGFVTPSQMSGPPPLKRQKTRKIQFEL